MASDFKNKVFTPYVKGMKSNVREIEWIDGKPREWVMADLEDLLLSSNMFARKLSWKNDSQVVKSIAKVVAEK